MHQSNIHKWKHSTIQRRQKLGLKVFKLFDCQKTLTQLAADKQRGWNLHKKKQLLTTNYKKYNLDWNTLKSVRANMFKGCLPQFISYAMIYGSVLELAMRIPHMRFHAFRISTYMFIYSESVWFLLCFIQICAYISAYGHILSQSA